MTAYAARGLGDSTDSEYTAMHTTIGGCAGSGQVFLEDNIVDAVMCVEDPLGIGRGAALDVAGAVGATTTVPGTKRRGDGGRASRTAVGARLAVSLLPIDPARYALPV